MLGITQLGNIIRPAITLNYTNLLHIRKGAAAAPPGVGGGGGDGQTLLIRSEFSFTQVEDTSISINSDLNNYYLKLIQAKAGRSTSSYRSIMA